MKARRQLRSCNGGARTDYEVFVDEPCCGDTPHLSTTSSRQPPKAARDKPVTTELSELVSRSAANGHASPTSASHDGGALKLSEIPARSKLLLGLLCTAYFMAGCGFSIPGPFFPREAKAKGMSPTVIGFVFGIYELVCFLGSLAFGQFMSAIGPKIVCAAGMFVGGGCTALFGFLDKAPAGATFVVLSFVLRTSEALGMSAFTAANFAIVSSEFENHIASIFALLETCIGVGLMIGPTIGGGLFEAGGFGMPFWVVGAFLMLNSIVFFVCLPPIKDKAPERKNGKMYTLLRSPLVCVCILQITLGACAMSFLFPTLSLHLSQFNLTTVEVSLFFVIAPLLQALTAPFWGYISDKKDLYNIQIPVACLFCAVGFLLVAPSPILHLPSKVWLVLLGLTLFGLFFGNCMIPTMKCFFIGAREIGMPDNLNTNGLVSGLFYAVFYLGGFIGPTIGGAMMQHLGFGYASSVVAALFLFGFCVTSTFFGFRGSGQCRKMTMDAESRSTANQSNHH